MYAARRGCSICMVFVHPRSSAACQNMSCLSGCLCPVKTGTWESESPQFQSHSQWINYENHSFPAMEVLSYIFPLYVSRPLHCLALCTFIASIGSGWLVEPKWSSCEVEYIPITSAVCSMHTLSVMPFQSFYYVLNVFLLAPWLFIVFCAVLPCPRPRLKRQPSSPGEGHTKKGCLSPHVGPQIRL